MRNLLIAAVLLASGCTAMGRSLILERARADFPACAAPEIVHEGRFRYYADVCGERVAYTLHEGGAITRDDGVGQDVPPQPSALERRRRGR